MQQDNQEERHKHNTKILIWICSIIIILVASSLAIYSYIFNHNEKKEQEYLKSLGSVKAELYLSKKEDWSNIISTIERLQFENNFQSIDEWREYLSEDELSELINIYSDKVEEFYIKDGYLEFLENKIKQKDWSNVDSFYNLSSELLTEKIKKQIYNDTTNLVFVQKEIEEKESAKQYEEYRIYQYMKTQFDILTNYGANYSPEIHDSQVEQLASEKFGISPYEAGSIYIYYETH